MKNLYDRLSPENQEVLIKESKLYPSTIEGLINELKNNISYAYLAYSDIASLVNHLNLKDYSPTTINDLFNN